jgi:hypothetical protein
MAHNPATTGTHAGASVISASYWLSPALRDDVLFPVAMARMTGPSAWPSCCSSRRRGNRTTLRAGLNGADDASEQPDKQYRGLLSHEHMSWGYRAAVVVAWRRSCMRTATAKTTP